MDVFGFVDIPLWLILVIVTFGLYYYYATVYYGVFSKMGLKGPRPIFPLGNLQELMRKGIIPAEAEWARKYGRIYGIHEGRNPLLMLSDLDILKAICVKEFNNFPNRRDFGMRENHVPPVSDFLDFQADDTWRHNRSTLTPAFTAGKLKNMTGIMNTAGTSLISALKPQADKRTPIEIKQFVGGYTMEVIAAAAFGIKVDAYNDPNDPFITNATKLFDPSPLNPVLLSAMICPILIPVLTFFKITFYAMDAVKFYSKIIEQTLKERRQNPEKHNDFLQLMITAETDAQTSDLDTSGENNSANGHLGGTKRGKGLTDSEIMGNSIIMFIAGYDPVATTISYVLYHLAKNVDVQRKLIAEIDQHFPGDIAPGYDEVNQLPYLDMVLAETMRINPVVDRMDRECKKDCTVGGLHFRRGMGVALPIYSIHHDPEYWPDPETFDPERFTPEKKKLHHPLQYIPFGYGPRNCIGMRFALVGMKIALVHLLKNYSFEPNEKTLPLRFGDSVFLTKALDGVWVTAVNRQR